MYAKLSDSKLLDLRTKLWTEHMDDLKDTFARGYRIKISKTNGRFCGFVDPAQEDGLAATVNTRIRKRQRKMTAARREVAARNLPCRSQIYDLELQGFLAEVKKKEQEDILNRDSEFFKKFPSRVRYTTWEEEFGHNRRSAFVPVAQVGEIKKAEPRRSPKSVTFISFPGNPVVPPGQHLITETPNRDLVITSAPPKTVPAPPSSENKDDGVRYPRPNMTPEEKANYAGSEIRRLCESMERSQNEINKEYVRAMETATKRLRPGERAMKEGKHILERKSVGLFFDGNLKYVRCYHYKPDGSSTGGSECTCNRNKGDHPREWELCEADKKLQAEGKLEIDMTTLEAQLAGLAKQIVDHPYRPAVMHNNMGGFLSKLERARMSEFD